MHNWQARTDCYLARWLPPCKVAVGLSLPGMYVSTIVIIIDTIEKCASGCAMCIAIFCIFGMTRDQIRDKCPGVIIT